MATIYSRQNDSVPSSTPRRRKGSRVNARNDVTLRRRTLDDYPMDHDRKDALRMLSDLRTARAEKMVSLQSSLGDTRKLSISSKQRFLGALTGEASPSPVPSPRDKSATFITVTEETNVFAPRRPESPFTTRSQATQTVSGPRPRFSSTATAPLPQRSSVTDQQKTVIRRPVSEPPRLLTPGGGRSFNHLRTSVSAYPSGLAQLLQEYNSTLRVECESPQPEIERPLSALQRPSSAVSQRPISGSRDFRLCRLLPLVVEGAESKGEENEPEEILPAIPVPEVEDVEDEGATPVLEGLTRAVDESGHDASAASSSRLDTDRPAAEPDPKPEEEPPPPPTPSPPPPESPPFYCWVDDATVSSVSINADDIANLHDVEGEGEHGEASVHPDEQLEDKRVPQKPEPTKSPPPEPKPASPIVETHPSPTKGRLLAKDRKKKEQVAPEVLPEVPKEEPEVEPVEEEVIEEPEEEIEPVLPAFICPSSEEKSHHTETKRWLMNSSFSTACRQTPLL